MISQAFDLRLTYPCDHVTTTEKAANLRSNGILLWHTCRAIGRPSIGEVNGSKIRVIIVAIADERDVVEWRPFRNKSYRKVSISLQSTAIVLIRNEPRASCPPRDCGTHNRKIRQLNKVGLKIEI
ncbi:hypothetical protein CHS0354_014173 [Potamilus streckersoni]|uniref:Uncharacterized protein n=1 Tax=Potamilus streckersoni TaxID=2493646 RepID=A0AAE0SN55_9BIVA|nr:hypothetical protein CHS0354_014173 [Potamilus streckersoni]